MTSNDTLHNLKAAARGLGYADASVEFSPRVDASESWQRIATRSDVVSYVATAFAELSGADLTDAVYSYAMARRAAFDIDAAMAI